MSYDDPHGEAPRVAPRPAGPPPEVDDGGDERGPRRRIGRGRNPLDAEELLRRVADLIAAHCGTWARNANFETGQPSIDAYVDRVTARPAWKRAAAR